MPNDMGPGLVSAALLALSFCAFFNQAVGQQLCTPTNPGTCLTGHYCGKNNVCVPSKSSANNATTYIILGCVIGGIVIIVAVILILYCGKWGWLKRLGGRASATETQSSPTAFQQPTPRDRWSRSFGKKLKLRFGGIKSNPYVANTVPAAPSMVGNNSFVVPDNNPPFDTRYIVGQDTRELGFESSSPSPYVATLSLSDNDRRPPVDYQGGNVSVGQTVVQLGGTSQQLEPYRSSSLTSLNMISSPIQYQDPGLQPLAQPTYPQQSPQMHRPQINIQAQIPSQPQPVVHQHYVPAQPMNPQQVSQPTQQAVVPHTHQVFPTPSIYPSLGHGHTHAPASALPTYSEALPRKF